jgi:hypothetical protein
VLAVAFGPWFTHAIPNLVGARRPSSVEPQ